MEVEGGMYPGVEVKLDSSSKVERRIVICEVRFSAALTIRVKIFGRVSSGAEEVDLVAVFGGVSSVSRHLGSRKLLKLASFLGLCRVFQWQALGKSHWFSQCLR